MARGGPRPGAGRPRNSAVTPAPISNAPAMVETPAATVPAPRVPADVSGPALATGMTPLDYMLTVMRDPSQDSARRDRMAMAAAPFVHIRPADAKPGKKEAAADAAKVAVHGKFAPGKAPLKLIGQR